MSKKWKTFDPKGHEISLFCPKCGEFNDFIDNYICVNCNTKIRLQYEEGD